MPIINVVNQTSDYIKGAIQDALYFKFTNRLQQLSDRIRNQHLNATESAELLETEIERINAEHRGDYD